MDICMVSDITKRREVEMSPMRDRRDNEQGKIGLLSLWAVGRLSFAIQLVHNSFISIIIDIPIKQVDDDGDDELIDTFCCPGLYQVSWSLINRVDSRQENVIHLFK